MSISYSKEKWARINVLLDKVLDLEDKTEQLNLLAELCGDDSELYNDVQQLLLTEYQLESGIDLDRGAAEFIETRQPAGLGHNSSDDCIGIRVGAYTLKEKLGQGGMGTVYLAHRSDGEFEQKVAIKIMPEQGRDSIAVDRFRREQQLLASLVHPNIAGLYDGGFTEDGQAYIVMEYVEGLELDAYCKINKLGVKARLDLVLQVIEALRYAHNQLVVHRDIKPSNILVTPDQKVKLLDFGIAKLLDGNSKLDLTRTGENILTPGFAAPEQLKGGVITIATDIYQLGLVCYELLCGKKAYRDKARSISELVVLISTGEPTPPSLALERPVVFETKEFDSSDGIVDTKKLQRVLEGDLDAIVLKSLQNEARDRYVSMAAFREDILAYFDNRPVQAREQNLLYNFRKYSRRHWRWLSVATVFLLSLVVYSVTLTQQAKEIRQALAQSEIEKNKAEQVSKFLASVFKSADPNVAGLEKITAKTLLENGEKRIDKDLAGVPQVQSHMLGLLGEIYSSQGNYNKSAILTEQAVELQRELSVDSELFASLLVDLGVVYTDTGKYKEAELYFDESIKLYESNQKFDPVKHAKLLASYGDLDYRLGNFDDGIIHLEKAINILSSSGVGGDEELATALNNMANIQSAKGDFASSKQNKIRAIELQKRVLGENHSYYSIYLYNLSVMLVNMEEFDDAKGYADKALDLQMKILDESHPYISESLKGLGVLFYKQGKFVEAESYLRKAVNRYQEADNHYFKAGALMWLGNVLRDQNDFEGAELFYIEMIDVFKNRVKNSTMAGRGLGQLAILYYLSKKNAESESAFREALAIMPDQGIRTSFVQVAYAQFLLGRGENKQANELLLIASEIRNRKFPERHSLIAEIEVLRGVALQREGKEEEALFYLEQGMSSLKNNKLFKYGHRRHLIEMGRHALHTFRMK